MCDCLQGKTKTAFGKSITLSSGTYVEMTTQLTTNKKYALRVQCKTAGACGPSYGYIYTFYRTNKACVTTLMPALQLDRPGYSPVAQKIQVINNNNNDDCRSNNHNHNSEDDDETPARTRNIIHSKNETKQL